MMERDKEFAERACPEYETLLEDFLGGGLVGADAERATAHLETCAACRGALEEAVAGARLLKVAGILASPAPEPGPAFARTVMARIRAEEHASAQEAPFWRPFVSLAWRFAATAALALAALVTYATVRHGAAYGNNTVAVQTDTRDIFSPDPAQAPASRDDVLIMVAGNENGKN
jgi:predicted anti-sigma-YlaC factor YlaD